MSIVDDRGTGLDDLLAPDGRPISPPRRRRRGVVALVLGLALALVATSVVGAALLWQAAPKVGHLGDPFAEIPAETRATTVPAAGQAMNILIVGSDSRTSGGDTANWTAGGQRSDVLMVVHLASDGRSAQIVSIPRDSWVPIPGYGTTKINAAFSDGGTSLAVQTIEQMTGVHIDHVAAIDFDGFAGITDALGGVRICVPAQVTDGIGTVPAGCSTMNGQQALEYVRQRKTLPGGDFDRERRQQNWMRQVLIGLSEQDIARHPIELAKVVNQVAAAVETDDGLSDADLLSLALSHRSLTAGQVSFLTAPLASPATGMEGAQSVVYLDPAAGAELWNAIKTDDMTAWLAQHPSNLLGDVVK